MPSLEPAVRFGFRLADLPDAEGVDGLRGECLAILGGAFAVGRPSPGEPNLL